MALLLRVQAKPLMECLLKMPRTEIRIDVPRQWHKENKIQAIKEDIQLSNFYEIILRYVFSSYEVEEIIDTPRLTNTMGTTIFVDNELYMQLYRMAALNGTHIKTLTDKALSLYASTTAEYHTTH